MNLQTSQILVQHLILPGYEKDRCFAMPGETIANVLQRHEWDFNLPTICVMNGQPVLRAEWNETIILPSDKIEFLSKPWGGGGSGGTGKTTQIIGIVAMIALAAIAPWAAGVVGTALGFGAAGIAGLTAVIGIGGALLLSTFLKPKSGGNTDSNNQESQLYSLSAAGNTARPFQTINISYGRMKIMGDYASSPYSEFVGDDQYLNVPLVIGAGRYFVEEVLMDDTSLWTYAGGYNPDIQGLQIDFTDPGVPVDLFPLNILQVAEVNNIQVPSWTGTEWVGGFVTNAADVSVIALSFDFAFPAGLFSVNEGSSQTQAASVTIEAQIRELDAFGAPISSYTNVFLETYTFATRQPKRLTQKVTLNGGRWEVRLRRTNAENNGETGSDAIVWVGLRAHIEGPQVFDDVSICAIRIKATSQVSNQSSRSFGIVATRILPTWNGTTFIDAATTNPVWACLDMATNATYGAGRPPSKIDLQKFISEAAAAATRGDAFNYNFTSATTFSKAFDLALGATRAKHCWAGDVLTLVRDEWKPIPQMLITDQQTIRGSVEVEYVFNDEDSSDAIICEFLNETTWKPAELQYPANSVDFTAEHPARIRLEGITNKDQIYRELIFLYRQAYYRRVKIKFDTEHDGRILKFGSAIKVQSRLPKRWGQSGEVLAYNSTLKVLTVTPNPDWTGAAQFYIEFRSKTGGYFGPVMCGQVMGFPNQILVNSGDLATVESQLGTTLVAVLDRMDGAEPPAYALGIESEMSRHVIVLNGRPSGNRVTLYCVEDLETVHDGAATTPGFPTPTDLYDPKTPVVGLLYALFRQGVAEPILDVTWFPAPGALFYRCQVSYDDQASWEQVYEGIDPKCSVVVGRVAYLHVRVAGISDRHGPWSVAGPIEGPIIRIGTDTVSTESLIKGLEDYVKNQIAATDAKVKEILDFVNSVSTEADFATMLEHVEQKENFQVGVGSINASIEFVTELAYSTQQAFAEYQITINAQIDDLEAEVQLTATSLATLESSYASFTTSVTASLGSLSASVTTNSTAIATLNGQFAAVYTLTLNVNGYVTGFQSINSGSFSAFTIQADVFRLAQPGVVGGDPVVPFQIGLSGGVAKLVMKGDMYADGTITARMIQAVSINTQHLSVDSVDIHQLIQNAAAKVWSGAVGGTVPVYASSEVGVCSTTFSMSQAGTVTLAGSISFDVTGLGVTVGSNNYTTANADIIYIRIYYNGILIQTRSYVVPLWNFANGAVGASNARLPSRMTAPIITAIYLGAGSATFEVRAQCGFLLNPGATGATIDSGGFIALVSNKTTLN